MATLFILSHMRYWVHSSRDAISPRGNHTEPRSGVNSGQTEARRPSMRPLDVPSNGYFFGGPRMENSARSKR